MTAMNTLTRSRKDFLKRLFPGEDCLTDAAACAVFGSDASRLSGAPMAVVRPSSEEQVAKLLAWAQDEGVPIHTRGRGTNMAGQTVPHIPDNPGGPGGVVVSMLKMDRLLEVDGRDFIARVQPGLVTADFQKALAAQQLLYPPDPASAAISTLGGNVATCAGGLRAVKYGVTRDYVLGMRVALPGGQVLALGSRCHKDVVGLDLVRLFVGSEGTLGVITELCLKLLPLPEATATLLAGFADLEAAMAAADAVFAAGVLPMALEFLGPEVVDCLKLSTQVPWPESVRAVLLFRLDGSAPALAADMPRLERAVAAAAPLYSATAQGADEEPLLEIRRSVSTASFHVAPDKHSDDVAVPRGKLLQALRGIREVGRETGLNILTFGHLGDGNIHVNTMFDAATQRAAADRAKDGILDVVLALGGAMSGEHGVGLAKHPYLDRQLGRPERAMMARVKAAFDPKGVMNPGKAF